ncbi:ral guanine nucleotide dissociation stimulator-like isoform X2 [Diceros bicornis minor]|uniref:ral guanine nucleotide dissociation stimulator-like n=1 Tax=Diceros bicornis minor TaxID=77932 RepID=UPI0026EB49C3|nr:ral guanine nucleotide dissociation stimulator-like [Diceros bicornis minor]XP_058404677.1 ral guanine nucleotide dissociation stimulator-like [Diceros bicornis minor]XP_058422769.1 ral guanine nucleotide dissociation stimulator-like isoform X2 [Diceros bicornis minor]XP_058422770.1 ral guanine nucleotide dissociation stimulator-like isoform X2 [Diceros bicornis minor]
MKKTPGGGKQDGGKAPAPATELQPAAEAEQWAVVEVELAPALLTSPLLALEPASPLSAVLALEQGPTSAPAGVRTAELESPGPSFLVGSPSPPVLVKQREKKPNIMAFPPKLVVEQLTVMDAECKILKNSSPCTVISALQKTSTNHLKNTQRKFPWRSLKNLRSAIAKTSP